MHVSKSHIIPYYCYPCFSAPASFGSTIVHKETSPLLLFPYHKNKIKIHKRGISGLPKFNQSTNYFIQLFTITVSFYLALLYNLTCWGLTYHFGVQYSIIASFSLLTWNHFVSRGFNPMIISTVSIAITNLTWQLVIDVCMKPWNLIKVGTNCSICIVCNFL